MASGSGLCLNPSPMAPHATRSFALFIWPERGVERNRIWKRKHQGSRPSQITRNFCLTSLEVANTGIECFFIRNWIWKKEWRSMEGPQSVGGDRIHWRWWVNQCGSHGSHCHCENWFPWLQVMLSLLSYADISVKPVWCHSNNAFKLEAEWTLWLMPAPLGQTILNTGRGARDVTIPGSSITSLSKSLSLWVW